MEKGLYTSSKEELLLESKKYIDDIKKAKKWEAQDLDQDQFPDKDQWGGLGYAGLNSTEFKEINAYLDGKINEFKSEGLPVDAIKLLDILCSDVEKFRDMIAPSTWDNLSYHRVPIFKYMEPEKFVKSLLKIENSRKMSVAYALKSRYKYEDTAKSLVDELDFLKKLKDEIDREIINRKGKVSGFTLKFIKNCIQEIIKKLEGYRDPH